MRRHIPNALTSANLIMGVLACMAATEGQPEVAAIYIAIGAFFDVFDGLVARALGVSGEFGKQLDSLADMVSFGVAPAFIAHELLLRALFIEAGELAPDSWMSYLHLVVLLIPLGAALRLARFNISTTETLDFQGMPTPANALLWAAVPLGASPHYSTEIWQSLWNNPWVLVFMCVLCLLLMTSTLPLMSLKYIKGDKRRILWQGLLVFGALILLAWAGLSAIPLIILLYLVLSILRNTLHGAEIQS